jgi:hypothetical protein
MGLLGLTVASAYFCIGAYRVGLMPSRACGPQDHRDLPISTSYICMRHFSDIIPGPTLWMPPVFCYGNAGEIVGTLIV